MNSHSLPVLHPRTSTNNPAFLIDCLRRSSLLARLLCRFCLILCVTAFASSAEKSSASELLMNALSPSVAAVPTESAVPKGLTASHANIAVFTSTASGSWGDSATWGGVGVPAPGDDVTISTGTIVTLDMNRSAHSLTTNQSSGPFDSGRLELNGNQLDLQGNGAFFTHRGNLTNSSATLSALSFVGNGIPGETVQFLQSNSGCSSSNLCNLQLRLKNSVTVKNINGYSLFNIGITIDASTVLDLTESLVFVGHFQNIKVINNAGTIQNGRLTTQRLVAINGSGIFDSELVIDSETTQAQGELRRWVALGSTGTLKLTGDTSTYAGIAISSGGSLDLNGHALRFLGNNASFINTGAVTNSGPTNTIYFSGNGIAGGITQSLQASSGFSNNVTVRCSNNVTVIPNQFTQLGNVVVDSGSLLNLTNGTLALTGPGLPLSVQGTLITTGSTIEMRGTGPQSLQTNLNGAGYNNLTINNPSGVNIPNPDANPITVPGTLTLAAGSFAPNGNLTMGTGATIARSAGQFAAAPIFGTTINIRYFSFTPISSGAEMPVANLLNNLAVETIGTTTVTLNPDVVVNGNLFVAQGATLTGPANRSLTIKGSLVTNVGTVSHPFVTFSSTGAQTIDGNGAWNGATATMAGIGSVSLASPVGFNNGSFTNNSTINTGSNFLTFRGSTFTNRGVINGNVQTQDSNVVLDAGTTGFNAAFRVWADTTTAKGTINSTLTIQSSAATLQVSAGEMLTVTGNTTINGPLSGGGTFRTNGSTVNNSALVSVAAFQLGGGTQSLGGTGGYSANTVTILNGSTTNLTANKQMSSLLINSGGTFNSSNRTLFLSGSGTPFTNAGSYISSNGTVEYNGTSSQFLSSTIPAYLNLSLNNTAGISAFAGLSVTGLLRVKAGTFTSSGTFKDVQVDNGAVFAGTNGTTMSVAGNWSNNGTFTPNLNTVNFIGVVSQSVGGTTATGFENLTTSGGSIVNLGQNISVRGLLALGSDLSTGANTLTMPSTGTSDGAADVIGNVKRTGFVGGGPALSFGNQFNSLAFAHGGTLPTDVTFNLVKALPLGFPNAVQRSYVITQTGGTGFSATLRLHYLDSELNGNTETNLKLFRFNGAWIQESSTARDTTNNWVERSGVTQFSPWALARPTTTAFDYDGDSRSDLSVRRPGDNVWHILRATAGYMAMEFGVAGDLLAPADYDGDGKTDVAMFRPSTGEWFIFNSGSRSFQTFSWGADGDMPVPADHDGDGKADLVVFRPSTNTWYTRFSSNNSFSTVGFGAVGDKPVVGDFDGDGRADIALYRPSESNWYILKTGFGFFIQTWGEAGDIPVPADYDGDGSTDVAVFRPSTGQWFRIRSTAGFDVVNWGASGDKPVPADYDGDGKADVAVFRPSNGTWYIVGSTAGQIINSFGQDGDLPTQGAFIY